MNKAFRRQVRAIWEGLEQVQGADEFANIEGGSIEQHRDRRLQLHHCANYAAILILLSEAEQHLNILEIGCGSGALSYASARIMPSGWKLTATDYSLPLLEHARRQYQSDNLRFEQLDLRALRPEQLRETDIVLFLEVIEHLPRDQAAGLLHTIYQGLRPGAGLILTTLDRSPFPRAFSGYAPHFVEYTYKTMVEFLASPENNPFERFRVFRLVSPRIAAEAVRAEKRGGYLINRSYRLILALIRKSHAAQGIWRAVSTFFFRLYHRLPQNGRFELEEYLDSLEFIRENPALRNKDSFGLVALLEKDKP